MDAGQIAFGLFLIVALFARAFLPYVIQEFLENRRILRASRALAAPSPLTPSAPHSRSVRPSPPATVNG